MSENDAVIYQRHAMDNGYCVIQATLNSEKSLNALNQPMIDSLLPALTQWESDDSVVAIILDSAGDKAFCAGGDVVELYHAMAAAPGAKQPFVEQYFTQEYLLDYKIHTFSKPIILWGNGFVMGGGLGLMAGASHRVVTEHSKVAMPEITIGLYPDVGATYFLNKMPDNLGLFLGLTAAQMNAADALEVNLADHFLLHQQKSDLLCQLRLVSWSDQQSSNHQAIDAMLETMASGNQLPVGNIERNREVLNLILATDDLKAVSDAILSLETDDKWLSKAQRSLEHGAWLSAKILERQLRVGKGLSLAECFKLELGVSVVCGQIGEVTEGIRALLIDRDNTPDWRYKTLESVDDQVIDQIFSPVWPSDEHPLAI